MKIIEVDSESTAMVYTVSMAFRVYFKDSNDFSNCSASDIKNLVKDRISQFISEKNNHVYEHGSGMVFNDVELKNRKTEFKHHSTTHTLPIKDVCDGKYSLALDYLNKMSSGVSDSIIKSLFVKLNEVTAETGNVVDEKGLSPEEFILQGLEKVKFGIDKEGKVRPPQMVVNPSQLGIFG